MDQTTTFDIRDRLPFPIDGLADAIRPPDAAPAGTASDTMSLAWVPWGCESQPGASMAPRAQGS